MVSVSGLFSWQFSVISSVDCFAYSLLCSVFFCVFVCSSCFILMKLSLKLGLLPSLDTVLVLFISFFMYFCGVLFVYVSIAEGLLTLDIGNASVFVI